MFTSFQLKIEVKPWKMISKAYLALVIVFFNLMITIGCATGKFRAPWSMQSDAPNVYKYYQGPEVPIEKLATLYIEDPVAIKFDGNYFSGTFAIMPGEHPIELWYTQVVEERKTSSLRSIIPTTFTAVAGRKYKAFTHDFFDDTSVPPHYWHPEIIEITEKGSTK